MATTGKRFAALGVGLGLALLAAAPAAASGGNTGGAREVMMPPRGAVTGAAGTGNNLYFHGGNPGVVTGSDKVYLVFWGSGWSNDPSGEAALLESFFGKVGGSTWNNSVTQYCQAIASGTSDCSSVSLANHAANPTGVLGGFWFDNSSAPRKPRQSQLAAEAVRAAANFHNTTAASNTTVQYVIATATGNSASGFGTSYCAWHSSTSSTYGNIAYTNLPYITDAGASCGANFNGLGSKAGITIVEGHEFAETETDIFPNGGWLDSGGAENGDKCAWSSATANVSFGGGSFPVQPLWSNANGGCVLSY